MILLIVYINYLIFYWNFGSLIYSIPLFILFFGGIFWIIKKSKKIIPDRRNNTVYEIKYTLTSFIIFFTVVFCYFSALEKGIIHFDFNFHIWSGILWIFFIILHDAYFYAIHRFLHTKFMMKHVHRVHHKSNPSNIYALLFAIFYNDFFTILGHCGYELFGSRIKNTWFHKYCATTTYHDVHHSYNNGNIWLYFIYLDLLFETKSKDTEIVFDKVSSYDK